MIVALSSLMIEGQGIVLVGLTPRELTGISQHGKFYTCKFCGRDSDHIPQRQREAIKSMAHVGVVCRETLAEKAASGFQPNMPPESVVLAISQENIARLGNSETIRIDGGEVVFCVSRIESEASFMVQAYARGQITRNSVVSDECKIGLARLNPN